MNIPWKDIIVGILRVVAYYALGVTMTGGNGNA